MVQIVEARIQGKVGFLREKGWNVLYTTGDLAKKLGVSRDRVKYLLLTRGIEPVARAGQYGQYDEAVLDKLREEIRAGRKGKSDANSPRTS